MYSAFCAPAVSAGSLTSPCSQRLTCTTFRGVTVYSRPQRVSLRPATFRRRPRVSYCSLSDNQGPQADAGDIVPQRTGFFPERARIVIALFVAFVICNCDRINLSVAILPMAREFGWSQSLVGIVQGSFYLGYLTTQLPSGYLSDRFGGRNVLSVGVIGWSLMTLLTPLAAASGSLPLLLSARILLGVGEGLAMPAMNAIVSKWVPRGERSQSLSLIYSGMYMGSVVGLLACPPLIAAYGWPSVFYFFGALGGVWYLAWELLTAATPSESRTISSDELKYITADMGDQKKGTGSVPWKMLLSNKATWAIIVAHFCCTWGYFVLLTWLPTFLNMKLGFDVASSSFLSVLPWIAMFASANIGGQIADRLLKRGMGMTTVRKLMQTVGFIGPAFFLSLVSITGEPYTVVGLMTAALAFGSFSQSGVYSNHQDIGPSYAGTLLGMSNTAAAVPGIIGVSTTGFILDATGNWNYVFGIAVGFYILGTIVFNLFATGEKQFS